MPKKKSKQPAKAGHKKVALRDLQPNNAENVKGGAFNAYLILDGVGGNAQGESTSSQSGQSPDLMFTAALIRK